MGRYFQAFNFSVCDNLFTFSSKNEFVSAILIPTAIARSSGTLLGSNLDSRALWHSSMERPSMLETLEDFDEREERIKFRPRTEEGVSAIHSTAFAFNAYVKKVKASFMKVCIICNSNHPPEPREYPLFDQWRPTSRPIRTSTSHRFHWRWRPSLFELPQFPRAFCVSRRSKGDSTHRASRKTNPCESRRCPVWPIPLFRDMLAASDGRANSRGVSQLAQSRRDEILRMKKIFTKWGVFAL